MPYFFPAARDCIAPALEIVEPPVTDRGRNRAQIIAGIVERPGGGAVRHFLRRHEIALDDIEMIELELDGDALHQALQRHVELRAAEAADEARRHLVGEHDAVDDIDIGDVVGAGDGAMHAVERPRHRRAQECTVVLKLIEPQRQNATLFGHRRFDFSDAVRAGACGDEMLDAVLDPFHRTAGNTGGDRHQHHVRKHRQLDAEAAA